MYFGIDNNWRGILIWWSVVTGLTGAILVFYTNLAANDDEAEKGNCSIDMPRLRNKKLQINIPRLFTKSIKC